MFNQIINTKCSMFSRKIPSIALLVALIFFATRASHADPGLRAVIEKPGPNNTLFVKYSGLQKSAGKCWISVAKVTADADDYEYWDWAYGADGIMAFQPLSPGKYEARLFSNWPDSGFQIQQRCPITIAPRTEQPDDPDNSSDPVWDLKILDTNGKPVDTLLLKQEFRVEATTQLSDNPPPWLEVAFRGPFGETQEATLKPDRLLADGKVLYASHESFGGKRGGIPYEGTLEIDDLSNGLYVRAQVVDRGKSNAVSLLVYDNSIQLSLAHYEKILRLISDDLIAQQMAINGIKSSGDTLPAGAADELGQWDDDVSRRLRWISRLRKILAKRNTPLAKLRAYDTLIPLIARSWIRSLRRPDVEWLDANSRLVNDRTVIQENYVELASVNAHALYQFFTEFTMTSPLYEIATGSDIYGQPVSGMRRLSRAGEIALVVVAAYGLNKLMKYLVEGSVTFRMPRMPFPKTLAINKARLKSAITRSQLGKTITVPLETTILDLNPPGQPSTRVAQALQKLRAWQDRVVGGRLVFESKGERLTEVTLFESVSDLAYESAFNRSLDPHKGRSRMDDILNVTEQKLDFVTPAHRAALERAIIAQRTRLAELHPLVDRIETLVGHRKNADYTAIEVFLSKNCTPEEAIVGHMWANRSHVSAKSVMREMNVTEAKLTDLLHNFLTKAQSVNSAQLRNEVIGNYLRGE